MSRHELDIKGTQKTIEGLIKKGNIHEAYNLLTTLHNKAQELREEVSMDDQEIRKLTISVNRRKDLIESIDNLVISMYSSTCKTERERGKQ